MSIQGHIENGVVVCDEPVSLPNGTVVRIEPVALPKQERTSTEQLVTDTDQPRTMPQMAQAWKAISRPIPEKDVPLSVDPDDYPMF